MEYDYRKKAPSLEVRALVKLAVFLCQQESFKSAILGLERLGYQEHENNRIRGQEYRENRLAKWDKVVEEQSEILSDSVLLPKSMKKSLMDWTSRIALEYLCWCRRLEVLFGVNRFYSMNFSTVEDWTCEGRLDDIKLCERLVQDERLTIIQRYTFACAYFCYSDSDDCLISTLWQKLSEEDKLALMKEHKYFEKDNIVCHLVKMWSLYLYGKKQLNYVLKSGLEEWTDMGSCAIVKRCWNMVSQECQRTIIVEMGLRAVLRWYRSKWNWWRLRLVNPEKDKYFMKRTFVPSCYYTELVCFYLSQMTTDERMTFFLEALKDSRYAPVLECFLEWNYQDHFLSTLSCLWAFIPMNSYAKLLLTVASRYTGDYDTVFSTLIYKREDRYFDFGSLLLELWKETPDRFKRFLFSDQRADQTLSQEVYNHGHNLLLRILKKKPLEVADVELFKSIFSDATVDEKKAIQSRCTKDIFSILMEKQNWGLIELVLNQSLSNEGMVSLKKQFMQSRGSKFCFHYTEERIQSVTGDFLDDFLDWVFMTPNEKNAFKFQLLYGDEFMLKCQNLKLGNDFLVLDRIINWCLDTESQKSNFKKSLPTIKAISESFLENRKWTRFDKFLIWCNDSRTEVQRYENRHDSFIQRTIEIDHTLAFNRHKKSFCRLLGLTPEAINKLNIAFTPRKVNFIINWLDDSTKDLVDILKYLRTLLHNQNSVLYFKTLFQEKYLKRKLITNVLQERFNFLITKLICELENKSSYVTLLDVNNHLLFPSNLKRRVRFLKKLDD